MDTNMIGIIAVVFVFLGMIVFFHSKHINLQEPPKKVVATTVIESLLNYQDEYDSIVNANLNDTFCSANSTNLVELNEQCSKLPSETCKTTSCCALVNGDTCLGGGASGPTFKTTQQGKPINVDYYYYMNMCYGSTCPTNDPDSLNQTYINQEKQINQDTISSLNKLGITFP
jgi:hypothetical protein